jgi:predicted secreted hydrolase
MNEDKIKSIILPKDNGPHDFVIEWWYFNGHLSDKNGKEYAFMDCFFKVNFNKAKIPHVLPHLIEDHFKNGEYIHFAHSVISDISNKKSYKEIQNISLISGDSFQKELLFINYKNGNFLDDPLNSEIIETSPNNFKLKTKHLNLNLKSRKDPLLEGGHGYVGTPQAGSYYYSLTDMEVKGKINILGKEIEVKGYAWMDHQWANAVYRNDKWTWFSFNLENGTEIMCVEYETPKGTDILINLIDKNGKQSQYKKAKIKSLGKIWKSKKTKAKYPLSWKIEIPEAKIEIKTISLLKEQEMIFGAINYWEGPMRVLAKINGKKIKGKGFMELVGYPADYNYLLLAGEEVEDNILRKVKKIFRKK